MTVHLEPQPHPSAPALATPPDDELPFTGPGRWLAAITFAVGSALQLAEFLLEPASGDTTARLAWWSAHPARMDWSQAAGLAAIGFLLMGVVVVWRLCRQDSRRLSALTMIMLGTAMIGLGFVHGVELAARWAFLAGHADAAPVILAADDLRVPGAVGMIMFLPMAALGNLLLAVVLFRSRYVPRLTALLPIAFAVLDFVAGLGVASHAVMLLMGLIIGWVIVSGYRRTRRAAATQASH